MYSVMKRLLIGRPLPSTALEEQRLSKRVALAVFGTDAIASTAFASQEILVVLVPVAGMAALDYLVPISLVVIALLAIVTASYRQTLYAYPSGGGSYIVSRENLGTGASLVAAGSLMVDYTLTVSVSIAAGVAAITSAVAPLRGHEVAISLVLLGLIVVANLRGVRESGRLFAPPTYLYIAMMTLLVGWGLIQVALGNLGQLQVNHPALDHFTGGQVALAGASSFLLLRAFSSGAVALSGVEAISNGIQAFRKPEPRNAAITLTAVATILGSLFLGIAVLAAHLRPTLSPDETILSTMGHAVFGNGVLYWLLQASTAMILTLSANTAFADFPRLSGIVASDGFLPRQLANRGDRLVLSNGILILAVASGALLVAFGGDVSALIPLFAVGLFMAFTLSQAGMVVHHWRLREPGWGWRLTINAVGATATSIVTIVVVVSKFTEGAWIPSLVIPALVLLFWSIRRHYRRVDSALECPPGTPLPRIVHSVVVLVGDRIHAGVLEALAYAKSLQPHSLHALHVAFDIEHARDIQERWAEYDFDIPLDILSSPYRELTRPVLSYIEALDAELSHDVVTVVVPEFVVHHWWDQLLHNQSALMLKGRLLFRKGTVVTSIPSHID
ncbi:MAG TPA: APC family permease [Acidimicrobiales bacterium]|nr:APC family permease [Acidimicrobiales bacterium]